MNKLTSLQLLGLTLVLSPAILFAQTTTEKIGPFDAPDMNRNTMDWGAVVRKCPQTANNANAAWRNYCDAKDGRANENTVEHEVTIGECKYKVTIKCFDEVDYEIRSGAINNKTDVIKDSDGKATIHLTPDACSLVSSVPKCDPPTMTLIEGKEEQCNNEETKDQSALFSFEVYKQTTSLLSAQNIE